MYLSMISLWITLSVVPIRLSLAANGLYSKSLINVSPRADLNFTELATYDGYISESHMVITSDGYVLGVFRVPIQRSCNKSRGVIIFQHGLFLSGDDCLIPGPGVAHCYVFADNCYDVWVPNSRGTRYTLKHTKYNPNQDSQFWDFAIDKLALYDLSAVIDYVLRETKKDQVSFIGHSQGATLALVLCAKKPEYNDKFKVSFGLSTTAWIDSSRFVVVDLLSALASVPSLQNLNVGILRRGGMIQEIGKIICGIEDNYQLCSLSLFTVMGYNKYQITKNVLPVVFGHMPAGISLKTLIHWGQIRNNGFKEYDYGSMGNLAHYGQLTPPFFNLTNVSMKWVFIGSGNDYLGDLKDLGKLTRRLRYSETCVLKDEYFGHLDFVYGKNIPDYITPTVIKYLESGVVECH